MRKEKPRRSGASSSQKSDLIFTCSAAGRAVVRPVVRPVRASASAGPDSADRPVGRLADPAAGRLGSAVRLDSGSLEYS